MTSRVLRALERIPVSALHTLATSCAQTQGAGNDSPLDTFIALELDRRISEMRGRPQRAEAVVVELPINTLFDELRAATEALPGIEAYENQDAAVFTPVDFTDDFTEVSNNLVTHTLVITPDEDERGVLTFTMSRRGAGFAIECHHRLLRYQVTEVYGAIGAWLDTPESFLDPDPPR